MSTVHGGQGNIVTTGLVLNLNAANPRSYAPPFNGTTWQNLVAVSSSISGTLTNGPTFSSANGGGIVFDGVDDLCSLPICNFPSNGPRSINIWIKTNTISSIRTLFGYGILASLQSNILHINAANNGDIYWGFNTADFYTSANSINTTNWFNICTTYAGGALNTTNVKIYINSNPQTITSTGTSIGSVANTANSNYSIASDNGIRFYNGTISNIQFYNRELSAAEISQNFNATRARFGV